LVAELDHVSRFEIDQMIVVLASRLLIAPPPGAELVSLEDPLRLEELQRPVDRRQRNSRVDLIGAAEDLDDIRVVLRFREDARDRTPLIGHPQPSLTAEPLDPA